MMTRVVVVLSLVCCVQWTSALGLDQSRRTHVESTSTAQSIFRGVTVTRTSSWANQTVPATITRFDNCHEAFLHLLSSSVEDPSAAKKGRARLPYVKRTLVPTSTNDTAKMCYFNFVTDVFDKMPSVQRPLISYPSYLTVHTMQSASAVGSARTVNSAPLLGDGGPANTMIVHGHRPMDVATVPQGSDFAIPIYGTWNSSYITKDCFTWATPLAPHFFSTMGFAVYPLPGRPYLTITGKLDSSFNSRSISEEQTIRWRILYSHTSDLDKGTMVGSGAFVIRRSSIDGTESSVVAGSPWVNVVLHGFESGWAAFVMHIEHNNTIGEVEGGDEGLVQVCDSGLSWTFMEADDNGKYKNHTQIVNQTFDWNPAVPPSRHRVHMEFPMPEEDSAGAATTQASGTDVQTTVTIGVTVSATTQPTAADLDKIAAELATKAGVPASQASVTITLISSGRAKGARMHRALHFASTASSSYLVEFTIEGLSDSATAGALATTNTIEAATTAAGVSGVQVSSVAAPVIEEVSAAPAASSSGPATLLAEWSLSSSTWDSSLSTTENIRAQDPSGTLSLKLPSDVNTGATCTSTNADPIVGTMLGHRQAKAMRIKRKTGLVMEWGGDVMATGANSDYSVALWVKLDDVTCGTPLVTTGVGGGGLFVCDGLQVKPDATAVGSALVAMKWYHLVVSVSDEKVVLYVDGAKAGELEDIAYSGLSLGQNSSGAAGGSNSSSNQIRLLADCDGCCLAGSSSMSPAGWVAHVGLYAGAVDLATVQAVFRAWSRPPVAEYVLTNVGRTHVSPHVNLSLASSIQGTPELTDLASTQCSNLSASQFEQVSMAGNAQAKALRVRAGTGVAIAGVGQLLKSGDASQWTVVLRFKLTHTGCSTPLIALTPAPVGTTGSYGVFVCEQIRVMPYPRANPSLSGADDGYAGPALTANEWHVAAVSSRLASDGTGIVKVYVDGALARTFELGKQTWDRAVRVETNSDMRVLADTTTSPCSSGGNDTPSAGLLSQLALYDRVLTYLEVVQATQRMGSLVPYVEAGGYGIGANGMGTCAGGVLGCQHACDQLFECVGFVVQDGQATGELKHTWEPTNSASTSTHTLYRKPSTAPVLHFDSATQSMTPIQQRWSWSDPDESGRPTPAVVDVSIKDQSCTDNGFELKNMAKGYILPRAEESSGWQGMTFNAQGALVCDTSSSSAYKDVSLSWILRVNTSTTSIVFEGADSSSGTPTPLCEAITTGKVLWAPTETTSDSFNPSDSPGGCGSCADSSSSASSFLCIACQAYDEWPPVKTASGWGAHITAEVMWGSSSSSAGLFPKHALRLSKGTGIVLPQVTDRMAGGDLSTFTIMFSIFLKLPVLESSCVLLVRFAGPVPDGGSRGGLYACKDGLAILTGATTTPTPPRRGPMSGGRWYRVTLTTNAASRKTVVYLNDLKVIDHTLDSATWQATTRIGGDDIVLLNFPDDQGDVQCQSTANQAGMAGGWIGRVLLFDHVLPEARVKGLQRGIAIACKGEPEECGGHGVCERGACACTSATANTAGWKGSGCDVRTCPTTSASDMECGMAGTCESDGSCVPFS